MSSKKVEVFTRLTPDEIDKRSMDMRSAVMEEAIKGEKVRYKSPKIQRNF